MRCGETTDRREEERNTHALSLLSSRFPFSLPRLSLLTSSEPRERVTGTEPKRGDRHERGRWAGFLAVTIPVSPHSCRSLISSLPHFARLTGMSHDGRNDRGAIWPAEGSGRERSRRSLISSVSAVPSSIIPFLTAPHLRSSTRVVSLSSLNPSSTSCPPEVSGKERSGMTRDERRMKWEEGTTETWNNRP